MSEKRTWTDEQDAIIMAMRWECDTWAAIAVVLKMSKQCVIVRGRSIGAVRSPNKLREINQAREDAAMCSKRVLGEIIAVDRQQIIPEVISPPRTCQFPIGDPRKSSFRFCCDPVMRPGKPYCSAHHALAFYTPQSVAA